MFRFAGNRIDGVYVFICLFPIRIGSSGRTPHKGPPKYKKPCSCSWYMYRLQNIKLWVSTNNVYDVRSIDIYLPSGHVSNTSYNWIEMVLHYRLLNKLCPFSVLLLLLIFILGDRKNTPKKNSFYFYSIFEQISRGWVHCIFVYDLWSSS